jgi:hypothetical protein
LGRHVRESSILVRFFCIPGGEKVKDLRVGMPEGTCSSLA